HDIKPAAVHHPHVALGVQGVIEPSEKVRLADPHDAGEDVEPSNPEVQPLVQRVIQEPRVYQLAVGSWQSAVFLLPTANGQPPTYNRRVRAIERILDQLNRAYGGEAWHGPALRELLEDVTEVEAKAHPLAGMHSILELVAHIRATMDLVSTRLAGNPKELTTEED